MPQFWFCLWQVSEVSRFPAPVEEIGKMELTSQAIFSCLAVSALAEKSWVLREIPNDDHSVCAQKQPGYSICLSS